MNRNDKNTKGRIAAYIVFFVTMLSLIPIMYLGRFNHPTGDDYYYGAATKSVWEATGSLAATIGEAMKGVALQYKIWQGTYSGMFLMYLPPNIFGDLTYRFVTTILLGVLTGGIFYLLKPVLCGYLKLSKEVWLLLSSVITLLCVQTVPSQGETFFWYNGSMYYTGFFAVTLFLFGIMIRYLLSPRKYHVPVLFLLALFLAGGNYVSLLPAILITVLLTGGLIWKKSKLAVGTGCAAVGMIAGLAVSAAAPGNIMRQNGMWQIAPHIAVIKSLLQGIHYILAWLGIWWILGIVLLTPILWRGLVKVTFRFPYPILVLGMAYGIFCSMSCPTFYTMNSTGPARAVAIVYYGFILFTFFSYIYLLGYVHRMVREKQFEFHRIKGMLWRKGIPAAVAGVLVLILLLSGSVAQTTTGKAIGLLVSGEAQAYEQEYQERMAILNDPAIKDVVFLPYEHQPDMLFVGDMTGDAMDETNQKIAEYFSKDSVRVQY